jgi:ferritin-like metal-binding protein YciE
MSVTNLHELMEEQIKDLYSAENQLLKMMPKIAKNMSDDSLRQAFEDHRVETEEHVRRLEQVAEHFGFKPTGKVCHGMKGLLEEGKEAMDEAEKGPVMDLALVSAAQRVEHYEIAGYGNAKAIAKEMGETDIEQILEQTLEEEKRADERMTEECLQGIFDSAREQTEEADMNEESEEERSSSRGRSGRSAGGRSKARSRPGMEGPRGGKGNGGRAGSRGRSRAGR